MTTELELNKMLMDHGYDTSAPHVQRAITHYVSGKWLFIFGGVGTGKTQFFRTISKFSDVPIQICRADEIALWEASDILEYMPKWRDRDLVIDDLGRESNNSTHYGMYFNPILMVLDYRTNIPNVRTHITSNLEGEEFMKNYEPRIIDRLRCFTGVRFEGDSRRGAMVTKPEGPNPTLDIAEEWIKNHFAKVQRNYAINAAEDYIRMTEEGELASCELHEKAVELYEKLGREGLIKLIYPNYNPKFTPDVGTILKAAT